MRGLVFSGITVGEGADSKAAAATWGWSIAAIVVVVEQSYEERERKGSRRRTGSHRFTRVWRNFTYLIRIPAVSRAETGSLVAK